MNKSRSDVHNLWSHLQMAEEAAEKASKYNELGYIQMRILRDNIQSEFQRALEASVFPDSNDEDADYKIKVGDTVCVNFNAVEFTLCGRAEVLHVPTDVGDSWIFKDRDTQVVHYVSERCTITKL